MSPAQPSRNESGPTAIDAREPGYDIPARLGDPVAAIATPALIVDLDAFERNLDRMRDRAAALGVALRAHAKMHKSADVARLQTTRGGAVGICCQKVSEAEALMRAGITDVLVSNEVVGEARVARLVRLAERGRIAVCADHPEQVAAFSRAVIARRAETGATGLTLDVLVEMDCGSGRCGTGSVAESVALARAIDAAPGLRLAGLQSYYGRAQHLYDPAERRAALATSLALTAETRDAIRAAGLPCDRVTGAGTGSFEIEGASGIYTEIQAGSYAFMDADYARVRSGDGTAPFAHALFVLATVISVPGRGRAVCDAGLKAVAVDSGLPLVHDRPGLAVTGLSDEHGNLSDPDGQLHLGDQIRLVPGHCDPTCNLHDWYVGVRDGRVACLWPVTARGKVF
ncbi:DSD1 family PLP-dependent enzyme [Methylobacterium nonmethylotrophicum]|uniref:DSD1 family PLP-dependent enzyme n=1 Tax=Methylobacterium nonmethylotrophicum TaxID=1141884 RepID=A0A4Z0NMW7_9HYPH|nr:DSD1 family PLP-dependent enzyme [Methylobacterium nonmethylotrophicum]TGD97347.1 DSD1 family PLP-dependent enzyme [Methylobacterium nonmethylotrophicum]